MEIDLSEGTWGAAQADRYVDGIHSFCELLAQTPAIGRRWRSDQPSSRRIEYGSHVIFTGRYLKGSQSFVSCTRGCCPRAAHSGSLLPNTLNSIQQTDTGTEIPCRSTNTNALPAISAPKRSRSSLTPRSPSARNAAAHSSASSPRQLFRSKAEAGMPTVMATQSRKRQQDRAKAGAPGTQLRLLELRTVNPPLTRPLQLQRQHLHPLRQPLRLRHLPRQPATVDRNALPSCLLRRRGR